MACDLTKNTAADLGLPPHVMPGRRIRALSLTENTSTLTAYGNDLSFDLAFVEQLKNLLEPRDLVVAVSASGASRNILLALEYAHVAGARTVVLTGMMPSAEHAVARCDVAVRVPATKIDMIEDLHLPVLHVAIRMLTERLHACPPPRDRDNGHGSAPVKTHNG
jgi:D-sedoheptulose 7-phosphate isomerase